MADPTTQLDEPTIRQLIQSVPFWYHRFDFGSEITTPGGHPTELMLGALDELGLPPSAHGLRVLDVGCCDGFFSFEMERRGAEVTSVDYAPSDQTGFAVAAQILGSKLVCHVGNVYDLTPERYGEYDIVLMLGLLYHLRHPMLALDAIRRLLKTGGLLFVETQAMVGNDALSTSAAPLWQYFPRNSLRGDYTNKWAPNPAGLSAVIADCEFEVQATSMVGERACVRAMAIDDWYLRTASTLDRSAGDRGARGGS